MTTLASCSSGPAGGADAAGADASSDATADASLGTPTVPPQPDCGVAVPTPSYVTSQSSSDLFVTARAGRVYYLDSQTREIRSFARDGSDARTVFAGAAANYAFLVDETAVFAAPEVAPRSLMRIPLDGSPPSKIGDFTSLVVLFGADAANIYGVVLGGPPAQIHRIPKAGGASAVIAPGPAAGKQAVSGGFLWLADNAGVHRYDLGAPPFPETLLIPGPCSHLVAADTVFCQASNDRISRFALDGTALPDAARASGTDGFLDVTAALADSALVFRSRSGGSQIDYVGAPGSTPRPVACVRRDTQLARDGDDLYVRERNTMGGPSVYFRIPLR